MKRPSEWDRGAGVEGPLSLMINEPPGRSSVGMGETPDRPSCWSPVEARVGRPHADRRPVLRKVDKSEDHWGA